ncbi:hypothetical protein V8F20_010631 [Naviculisporaceae sp. PSN 640]
MHFIQTIVLSLATAVGTTTAIDIYLKSAGNCGSGNTIVCRGINPNACCGTFDQRFTTIGFYGIPTNWAISCHGYMNGPCTGLKEIQHARNKNFICLQDGPFMSGFYKFLPGKRGAAVDAVSALSAQCGPGDSDGQGCIKSVKPDLLELEDGAKYDIAALEGEKLNKIYNLAAAGANSTEVDAVISHLKI